MAHAEMNLKELIPLYEERQKKYPYKPELLSQREIYKINPDFPKEDEILSIGVEQSETIKQVC